MPPPRKISMARRREVGDWGMVSAHLLNPLSHLFAKRL